MQLFERFWLAHKWIRYTRMYCTRSVNILWKQSNSQAYLLGLRRTVYKSKCGVIKYMLWRRLVVQNGGFFYGTLWRYLAATGFRDACDVIVSERLRVFPLNDIILRRWPPTLPGTEGSTASPPNTSPPESCWNHRNDKI